MEMIMKEYKNDWVNNSIMCKKGLGGGKSGVTHQLTESVQGQYVYTMGPYSNPVLNIKPGDQVICETLDAFEGKITSENDIPS